MADTIVYCYSETTGELLGSEPEDLDPIKGLPMRQANSTDVVPPVAGQFEAAVTEDSGLSWTLVPDYRWVDVYNEEGEIIDKLELGQELPLNHTTELTASQTLAAAKRERIEELRRLCSVEIVSGHSSSVLGAAHTYPTRVMDQQNLSAICLAASVSTDPVWTCNFWCADNAQVWARRSHTKEEIMAVGVEIQQAISSQQDKLDSLINQVNDPLTDTVDKVNKIIW